MRNTVLATAVAAALTLGAATASAQTKGNATKAELQGVQEQVQALVERLNRLETSNSQLQGENAELKALADRREAEIDYLKAQTKDLREESAVASGEIAKVKGSDWASKIKARGDLRYRHEKIMQERLDDEQIEDAADRDRHRLRVRLGFDAQVTDNIKATLLLATGADDPRSSNQTLGSNATRKPIGLDQAYADWRFMHGGHVLLGKMPNPVWRPGQSLFYDNDYNPEGGALKIDRGLMFATAYGYWLTEQFNSSRTGENSDANIFGLQAGLKFPMFGGETVLAANYYTCGACEDNSPLFNNSGNGNTTYTPVDSTSALLTYGYDVVEAGAQLGFTAFNQPFTLWGNYARNLADDVEFDTAYALGVMLGRASNAGTWEAGLFYLSIDKDALFGQFVDSDFGDGKTDSDGWVLKAGYAPVRNFTFNASYFINTLNKDVGTELDYDRLQLDMNYKF